MTSFVRYNNRNSFLTLYKKIKKRNTIEILKYIQKLLCEKKMGRKTFFVKKGRVYGTPPG